MSTSQRLTVRSESGGLHIVAIWQGLAQYADRIGGISAHVDAEHGVELLTIEVVDVGESQLRRVAAALSQSPFPMTARIEPGGPGRDDAARALA